MGFIHKSHGQSAISVEQRNDSFYIHPAYGYSITCPTCDAQPLQGGECIECGGSGEVAYYAEHSFGKKWREHPHPEFLLEDVPDLIKALADLPTCPDAVKQAINEVALDLR